MAIPGRDYLVCFEDWKNILSRGDYLKVDKVEGKIKIFTLQTNLPYFFRTVVGVA